MLKGVNLQEKLEQVDAFSAICMINYIVADFHVRDSANEGAETFIRSKIRDLQKPEEVAPKGLEHLPPEKRKVPDYIIPDENGYPGLDFGPMG